MGKWKVLLYFLIYLLFGILAIALSQSLLSIFQIDQLRCLVKVNRSKNTAVRATFKDAPGYWTSKNTYSYLPDKRGCINKQGGRQNLEMGRL